MTDPVSDMLTRIRNAALARHERTLVPASQLKKHIAEIDSSFRAQIAEREVCLKDQIQKAQTTGKLDEAESLEKQLATEIRRLQEDCEGRKEKLRASFAG